MKKFLKVFIIIAIIFALLFIAAAASVPLWFPVNKVKTIITEKLSEQTGRKVKIEGMEFNLFTGFELNNVTISESPKYKTKKPFIKTDKIILKYNLFALIKRTLLINDFQLISPYGYIIKEETGHFNFSDILENISKGKTKKAVTKEKRKPQKEKKQGKSSLINLIVTGVSIKDGNFTYLDRSKAPFMKVGIRNLNFKLDDLVLSGLKPVLLSLKCTTFYNDYNIPVSLKSGVKTDLKNQKVMINMESFEIGGIKSTGKIKITEFQNIRGNIVSVSNTKKMLEVLPPDLSEKIKNMDVSIDIKNNLKFSLINNKLDFTSNLKMSSGSLSYKGKKVVDGLSAGFDITENYNLTGNIDFTLAGSKVNIKAKGENINEPFESVVTVGVTSPKFAVQYLLAMFPKKDKKKKKDMTEKELKLLKKKKKAAAAKTKKAIRSIKGKKLPGFYLNLDAGSIVYKDIETGRAVSNIRFVENKLYAETSINAYKGSVNNNFVVNVEKESYSTYLKIKNIKVNNLIEDAATIIPKDEKKKDKKTLLDDIKNKVYGKFFMESGFSGNTFDDVGRTIKGDGSFYMKNGRITPIDMGRKLSRKFGAEFLGKEIPFNTMDGEFTMSGGRINIKKLRIEHKDGDMKIRAKGYVSLDKKLDMKVETDISPSEAKSFERYLNKTFGIKDARYAFDKNGWMPFDFRVYNTIKNKQYDLSQPRMTENIKRNLAKKAETEVKKAIEEKGKEFLENLFKK